jgi:hypothetical protein
MAPRKKKNATPQPHTNQSRDTDPFARTFRSFALGKLRHFLGCEAALEWRREHERTIIKRASACTLLEPK